MPRSGTSGKSALPPRKSEVHGISTGLVKQVSRPMLARFARREGPCRGYSDHDRVSGRFAGCHGCDKPHTGREARSARRFRRELLPCRHGAVAQWSEQGTHNPSVVGSIPTSPTSPTSPTRSEGAQGVQPGDLLEAGEVGIGADDAQAVLECERCERCVTDQVASQVEIAHESS